MSASASMITRKLPHQRPIPSRDPRAFRILTYVVASVTLGLLAWAVASNESTVIRSFWTIGFWIVSVAAADLVSLDTSRASLQLSFSYPLLLTAAFVYQPAVGGLIALLGTADPRELRREITVTTGLFNRCQIALSVMTASVVFRAVGGPQLGWPLVLGAGVLAVTADMLVNATLVGAGASLQHSVGWRQTVKSFSSGGLKPSVAYLMTYGLYGLSAIILRELFLLYGFWSFAAFIILIVLGRELFAHSERLSRVTRQLEATGEALRGVSQTIEEERRDERAKVAASLHDEVLQQLHHVHLMGEVLRHDLASGRLLDLEHDLPELLGATESASESIRSLIRDLRSSSIGRGGLTPTVGLLVEDLTSRTKIHIEAHLSDVGGTPQIQLLVYQVAREALQNAVKHSDADRIEVRLYRDGPTIRLVVIDDGCGFAYSDVDRRMHFGLELMKERLIMVGGSLEIDTAPGEGTRISAEFPWELRF
jgi:signal transduction histidine kinase